MEKHISHHFCGVTDSFPLWGPGGVWRLDSGPNLQPCLPPLVFCEAVLQRPHWGWFVDQKMHFRAVATKNRWPTAKNFSSWSWPQARWWFEAVFYFYPETLGKMKPFWRAYFQMSWNHQLARAEGHLDSQTKPSTKLPGIKKTVTWRPSDDHMATFFGT